MSTRVITFLTEEDKELDLDKTAKKRLQIRKRVARFREKHPEYTAKWNRLWNAKVAAQRKEMRDV